VTTVFRMATSAGTGVNSPTGTVGTSTNIDGDALSANQTEDAAFSRKGLWVDLAEIRYTPLDMLTLRGGKMDNPFWNGWSSSLMWDPDLNPEGYVQELNLPLGIYATLGQLSINEASGFHDANPWMFAERLGVKEELPMDMWGQLSVADYGFTHETGNTRQTVGANNNVLTSSFNILHLDGKLLLHVLGQPLTFEGGFVRNTQESGYVVAGRRRPSGRDGNILGLTLGTASKAHTWEVAYYHKQLGANAVISDFVDDDFGYGGTNQGGHIMWVGYAPRDNVLLKAMFYNTHLLDKTLAPATAPYVSHLMLDVVVKI
jgi:Putative porin